MKKMSQLRKYTSKQLEAELARRRLILVFNKDKLVEIPLNSLKESNVGKVTSAKMKKDILFMITNKDTWVANFIGGQKLKNDRNN